MAKKILGKLYYSISDMEEELGLKNLHRAFKLCPGKYHLPSYQYRCRVLFTEEEYEKNIDLIKNGKTLLSK